MRPAAASNNGENIFSFLSGAFAVISLRIASQKLKLLFHPNQEISLIDSTVSIQSISSKHSFPFKVTGTSCFEKYRIY